MKSEKRKMLNRWCIWIGVMMFIVWGIVIIIDPRAADSVSVWNLRDYLGISALQSAIAFILTALSTVLGILINGNRPKTTVLLLFPQLLLLLWVAAFTIKTCAFDEMTPSGYAVEHGLYVVSMISTPLVAFGYLASLLCFYRRW